MAKEKKIPVEVVQGVKHEGSYPSIGKVIDMVESEAHRLVKLGAVKFHKVIAEVKAEADKIAKEAEAEEKKVIAAIKKAMSMDEIREIIPDDEARPAVVDAAGKRLEEIGEADLNKEAGK